MYTLTIIGWKLGLKKISLTKTVRHHTGYGLAKSKRCTDDILNDEVVKFTHLNHEQAQTFLRDITEVGAIGEIQEEMV